MANLARSLCIALCMTVAAIPAASAADAALKTLLDGPQRSEANRARDVWRKPADTLQFAGIKPNMTVIEIWPGGGWWTEILAPYLKDQGNYIAAISNGADGTTFDRNNQSFRTKFDPAQPNYAKVQTIPFGPTSKELAPAGSADMILTFRNLHNFIGGGFADAAMQAFYKALKPGGVLLIEDHRAPASKPQDPKAESGYVRQDFATAMATKAGFKPAGTSDIYANPKDTKDYEKGVWTLPPVLTLKDQDRARYLAIGESDRFLLRFEKPKQ